MSAEPPRSFFGLNSSMRRQRQQHHNEYRAQRVRYEEEKMKQSAGYDLDGPVLKSGVLKVRTTIHTWTKFYCELRHGMLIMFKEEKPDSWIGTIILSGGTVMERPSRKEGFSWKFFHPLRPSIHAPRGPKGELWINILRMPSDYCIFRVPTAEEAQSWIEAFKVATYGPHYNDDTDRTQETPTPHRGRPLGPPSSVGSPSRGAVSSEASEALRKALEDAAEEQAHREAEDVDSSNSLPPPSKGAHPSHFIAPEAPVDVAENEWVPSTMSTDTLPTKSFVAVPETLQAFWHKMQQKAPGSTIKLPASFCQPRTLLQAASDNFLHADMLTDAAKHALPQGRMLCVVRWCLATLTEIARDPRPPQLPLLGEIFRACFNHPAHGVTPCTRTFYAAEHVSGKPHVSAFHGGNYRSGWDVDGALSPKAKIFGNTVCYLTEGEIAVKLHRFNETYLVTFPPRYLVGVAAGAITCMIDGTVVVDCAASGYRLKADIQAGSGVTTGVVTHNDTEVCHVKGNVNHEFAIVSPDGESEVMWSSNADLFDLRLPRMECHEEELWHLNSEEGPCFDTQRVWQNVFEALHNGRAAEADELETALRQTVNAHEENNSPKLFSFENSVWRHSAGSQRAWDHLTDVYEYQSEAQHMIMSIDDVTTRQHSNSGAGPPIMRQGSRPELLSSASDTLEGITSDVSSAFQPAPSPVRAGTPSHRSRSKSQLGSIQESVRPPIDVTGNGELVETLKAQLDAANNRLARMEQIFIAFAVLMIALMIWK